MPLKSNNGSIRIYFTFNGVNYNLSRLGKFSDSVAIDQAYRILKAIETDITIGRFNCKDSKELFRAYHPLSKLIDSQTKAASSVDCKVLVELKLCSAELRDRNLHQTMNFLKRYDKPIKSKDEALKFWQWLQLTSKGNARTINRHLTALKPVCPYFADIPKLKEPTIKDEKPFSKDEIKAIVTTFDEKFPHYSPFIKFLLSTGCRPNEATALKWQDVDFDNKQITICEALAIANDGSKVAKDTKTHVIRTVPMSSKVLELLQQHDKAMVRREFQGKEVDLVFPSPNGCFIDIRTFRSRVWIKALELANVPYRKLYNTKHSFCSHFLNEHPDFVQLASITHGTKSGIATLQKHYAHVVNKPSMPDMF